MMRSINNKQQGMITMAAAVILPVLVIFIGLALTYSYALTQQTQLGNASEAAAMYVAKRGADDKLRNLPTAHALIQQFNGLKNLSSSDISLSYSGDQYRISSNQQSLAFIKSKSTTGLKVVNKGAASNANKAGAQFDIALAIDLTGSIGNGIDDVKRILNNVIDNLTSQFGENNIRISLIPFSKYVSVKDADWLPTSSGNIRCLDSLSLTSATGFPRYPLTVDQLFDDPTSIFLRSYPRDTSPALTDPNARICPHIPVLPLTTNFTQIKAEINKINYLDAYTITYHSVIMAARMLSQNWLEQWQTEQKYRPNSHKAVIILTDAWEYDLHEDEAKFLNRFGLCQSIHDNNIKMYGIQAGSIFNSNSWLIDCFGANNFQPLDQLPTLINTMLTDVGVGNSSQTLKLVP